MKKAILWTAGVLVLAAAGFAGFASMQEGTTPEGTTLAGANVAGLTREQLEEKLRAWWEEKSTAVLQPTSHLLAKQPEPLDLKTLGILPDFDETLRGVRLQEYTDSLLGKEVKGAPIKIVWTHSGGDFEALAQFVDENAKPVQPASVTFAGGKFNRSYEIPTFALDTEQVGEAALQAMVEQTPKFVMPMKTGDVSISKEDIDGINTVVQSFSTTFSPGNLNRTHNIKLAAASLNGAVLMPGETLSYNETVGKRTSANGYKIAGVYANGRHEVDYGGGICQVSTTLFNVVALADLEVVSRMNHSMPVPYVPVGRDAAVDYNMIDFKFSNSHDTPIAISSEIVGGKITFYVLGSKKLDVDVKLVTSDHSSWGNGVKYVTDNSLRAGATRVIEKGSMGRKCTTWKVVEKDGVEISRVKMFDSIYRASPRIVARGTRSAPSQSAPEATPVSTPEPSSEIGG